MSSADPLARAFAAAWAGGPERAVSEDMVQALYDQTAAARASLPELAHLFDDSAFAAAIARGCPTSESVAYVARIHGADLALALAAGRGHGAAIAALERIHRGPLEQACWRFVTQAHGIDDLRQMLREKLFVAAAPARPAIAEYAGHGKLASWLRVTACRLFLDGLKRKDRAREHPASDSELGVLRDPSDLALDAIKAQYRRSVAAAMTTAAARLSPGERHVLRMHLVAGLSIDQLGFALGVHRATAARRIAQARDHLAEATRAALGEALAIAPDELSAIAALVTSRLDISIGALLASRVEPA